MLPFFSVLLFRGVNAALPQQVIYDSIFTSSEFGEKQQ
jgi:hypothetical protein